MVATMRSRKCFVPNRVMKNRPVPMQCAALFLRGSDEYLMAFSQVLTADQAQAMFNRGQGYIHALKVAGIVCDQEAADMEYLLRAKASQHNWNLTDA